MNLPWLFGPQLFDRQNLNETLVAALKEKVAGYVPNGHCLMSMLLEEVENGLVDGDGIVDEHSLVGKFEDLFQNGLVNVARHLVVGPEKEDEVEHGLLIDGLTVGQVLLAHEPYLGNTGDAEVFAVQFDHTGDQLELSDEGT